MVDVHQHVDDRAELAVAALLRVDACASVEPIRYPAESRRQRRSMPDRDERTDCGWRPREGIVRPGLRPRARALAQAARLSAVGDVSLPPRQA